MGDYTRLNLDATLRASTPEAVVKALECLASGAELVDQGCLGAMSVDVASSVLTSRSGVGYFPGADGTASVERLADGRIRLKCHSSFKNYDRQVEVFCAWIAPHLDTAEGDVVGEVEAEGFFGNQVSRLVVQAGGIHRTSTSSQGECN